MSENPVCGDIAFIRLSLMNEALTRVERLPYPGEIQSCLKRRRSLLDLTNLLYIVCGGEELPEFSPEPDKPPQPEYTPEKSTTEPLPETKALMEFLGKAGGNMLRSAAGQAAMTGTVNADTAKRAAVSGIAQTISMMMREERDK